MPLWTYLAVVAVVASVPLMWWSVAGEAAGKLTRANLHDSRQAVPDLRDVRLGASARLRIVEPSFEWLAERARRLTPVGVLRSLEQRIRLAGSPPRWPLERVLGVKLVGGVLGLLLALLQVAGGPSFGTLLWGSCLVAVGYLGPDGFLIVRARDRQEKIGRALPDVLDQVTISVEAGLGFEAALAQAGRTGDGPLAQELVRTMQDIQVGMRRPDALDQLLDRTDVPDLRHFVRAIKQAEQYGVPTAQVLRVQSKELRDKRRQRAEERAMKIPVKIVFPVVLCIFPALFVVVVGPGAIRISENLF